MPPTVTAKAWTICCGKTGAMIKSHKNSEVREIASLTKIMTCIISLKLSN